MFSKLLKYDLRAVFKYWWIAAVTSLALAVFGGGCLRTVVAAGEELSTFHTFSILGMVLSFVGLCLFVTLSEILILVRFYKNFFTDEGYLTFTLPVKKTSLLNSKLAAAFIMSSASLFLFFVDIFILIVIGAGEEIFTPEVIKGLKEIALLFFTERVLFNIAISVEFIVLFAILTVVQILGIFICITVAAVIAKKHKVLAAIGIYYVASGAVGFISQLLFIPNYLFISSSGDVPLTRVIGLIAELPENMMQFTFVICLLGIVAIALLAFGLMWLLEYYLLDRRLNLE